MKITRIITANNRTDLQDKIRNFIAETNREPIVFAKGESLKIIVPQYIYPGEEHPNFSFIDEDSVTIDGILFYSTQNFYFPDTEVSLDDGVFVLQG